MNSYLGSFAILMAPLAVGAFATCALRSMYQAEWWARYCATMPDAKTARMVVEQREKDMAMLQKESLRVVPTRINRPYLRIVDKGRPVKFETDGGV